MTDDTLNHNQNQNETEEEEEQDQVISAGVDLSSDLNYNILRRLPAKSVGRFRCVSKEWQILLSNAKFINDQFIFNNHQTKVILQRDFNFVTVDFRNDSNNESHPVTFYEALTFRPTTNRRYDIRGSCYGLVLLIDLDSLALSILNPITHELRQLPSIPQSIGSRLLLFGFGYCSKDDEFTVIVVSDRTRSSPVYMLKKNRWKRVEDSPLALHGCGTFVDGCIHWSGYRGLDNSYVVFAFDLARERFREVEKPEGLKADFRMYVLGGCLCLVRHTSSFLHKRSCTNIWVMKKYGLRDSWTKYVAHTTSQDILMFHPLFFWNGDEYIVAASQVRFILFCLKQRTSATIAVRGEQSPEFFLGGKWTFVDSLFSPNSSNALEGPNCIQV